MTLHFNSLTRKKASGAESFKIMFKNIFSLIIILCAVAGAFAQSPHLDITFNGNGRSLIDISPNSDRVIDTLIQSDGKIILVGTANLDNFMFQTTFFALTRFNTNGTPDASFGDNGKVATDFAGNALHDIALSAAIQPDDKIVVAGFIRLISNGDGFFAVIRFNADGTVDDSFGDNGRVTVSFISPINDAYAVTIAPSGDIVVAGNYFTGGPTLQTGVARLSSTGAVLGTMTETQATGPGGYNSPNAVLVQPDGKIVTAGYYYPGGPNPSNIKMVRFNPDGSRDATFGTDGRVWMNEGINEVIHDVRLLSDGRIIVCGIRGNDFLLMRFLPNGQLDPDFGTNGRVTTAFGAGYAIPGNMVVRPNGKILLAGRAVNHIAVAYYNEDGSPDTSFSGDGKLEFIYPPSASTIATSVAIDSFGRIVIGANSAFAFAAVRLYTLDPVPVTISGQARTSDGSPLRGVRVGLTDASGITRWALTSNFGFFGFDDVPTGQTCNLFVRGSKTHIFESRDIGLNEAVNNADLIGTPRAEKELTVMVRTPQAPVKKLK